MRTLRLAVATTATAMVLLNVAANAAVAQSPSPEPPPWFGGRVEMLEHGFAPPADLTDLDKAAASAHARWSVDDTTTHIEVPEVVELPAGPTRLITMGDSGGWETAFYLGSSASTFVVVCVGRERPNDDWLSIAETFEFLPAE